MVSYANHVEMMWGYPLRQRQLVNVNNYMPKE